MRRSLLLATTVFLTTSTALALLAAAAYLRPAGLPEGADRWEEAANRRLALAFYDAVNVAIATGDLIPLAEVVAPALLADGRAGDGQSGRIGLERRLRSLHATAPSVRLTVAALAIDDDLAIARLQLDGGFEGTFIGLDLVEGPEPWAPMDLLLLAGGRVVSIESVTEGATPEAGLLEPALRVGVEIAADGRQDVGVRRITLAPGAEYAAGAVEGFGQLFVEWGKVGVEAAVVTAFPAPVTTLSAGERLARLDGVAFTLRNDGTTPATLLDIAAVDPGDAPLPRETSNLLADGGVEIEILGGGLTMHVPSGPAVLATGRVTLPPGARLAWAEAAGPVLLQVEAGTARLDPGVGVAWVMNRDDGRPATLGDDLLPPGSGALVVAGNPVEVRAEPGDWLVVLVVVWLPAREATPVAAGPPAA
jgi:hypothetical protein